MHVSPNSNSAVRSIGLARWLAVFGVLALLVLGRNERV